MSIGDQSNVQNAVSTATSSSQDNLNNLNAQNQAQYGMFNNMYGPAFNQANNNFGNIMGGYGSFLGTMPNTGNNLQSFLGSGSNRYTPQLQAPSMLSGSPFASNSAFQTGPSSWNTGSASGSTTDGSTTSTDPTQDQFNSLFAKYGINPATSGTTASANPTTGPNSNMYSSLTAPGNNLDWGALSPAMSGYSNFATTGGYSPEDIAALKSSALAPISSAYSSAQRNATQAGMINPSLTNVGATQTKLAHDQAADLEQGTMNAEGSIAQLVNQGKLSGLGGLAGIGSNLYGTNMNATQGLRGQDLSAILGGGQQQLGALSGMTGLYGTTPGMLSLMQSGMLNSAQQGLGLQSLQNQVGELGIQGALGAAGVPGDFSQAMGDIGSVFGLAGDVAGGLTGLKNIFK